MYVPALYFIITQALLRPGWPGFVNLYNDWANVALYGGLFFFGYIFSLHQNAKNIVSKNWFISLALAILSASAIFFIEQKFHLTPGYNIEYMAFKGLHGLNTYLWVIFFIGFGGKFINKSNSFLNYVRNFSFPLYMIHLIPITILDYYFLSLTISVYLKVSIVIITTYIFSLFFYELFIKRITIMRFLFGLKVKKKET